LYVSGTHIIIQVKINTVNSSLSEGLFACCTARAPYALDSFPATGSMDLLEWVKYSNYFCFN